MPTLNCNEEIFSPTSFPDIHTEQVPIDRFVQFCSTLAAKASVDLLISQV